ncbi:hypothetical protein WR25_02777 [Diploscapter pachys]|uniref:Uncharacterized protein n=1 Tax=Diploscapter pachys TaxID=2018661 RepID=A0A2A2L603_9BILA|nr:hypothetical protein WR25_02777 [Diploscapter pachys]
MCSISVYSIFLLTFLLTVSIALVSSDEEIVVEDAEPAELVLLGDAIDKYTESRMGKRSIVLGRNAFRPAKRRSMALGRTGLRPGKRSLPLLIEENERMGMGPAEETVRWQSKRSMAFGRNNFRPAKRAQIIRAE